MPGELLVKFTKDAAQAIEQARGRDDPAAPLVIGIEPLDQLFMTYGVAAIEPVFPHSQDSEAIASKFPERAKRIPPGAEVPDLSRTYLLHLGEGDVLTAAAEFARDPHVEYAQPNYLAIIQTTQENPQ